jgi:hypothetical protein
VPCREFLLDDGLQAAEAARDAELERGRGVRAVRFGAQRKQRADAIAAF